MLILAMFACTDAPAASDTGHHHHHHGEDTASYDTTKAADTDGGTFHVMYGTDPDPVMESEEFAVTFQVFAAGDMSTLLTDVTVDADGFMPEHEHGMNVTPAATMNQDGSWTLSPFLFHMAGHWEIRVDVAQGDTSDSVTFHAECCG